MLVCCLATWQQEDLLLTSRGPAKPHSEVCNLHIGMQHRQAVANLSVTTANELALPCRYAAHAHPPFCPKMCTMLVFDGWKPLHSCPREDGYLLIKCLPGHCTSGVSGNQAML